LDAHAVPEVLENRQSPHATGTDAGFVGLVSQRNVKEIAQ
jgi:hypothetical protein